VLDPTGVGQPVFDLFRAHGLDPLGISITGGDLPHAQGELGVTVPKRDLIHALLVALQTDRLRIAEGLPFADVLVEEMNAFRQNFSPSGHDTYNAAAGAHDDLILALGCAVWVAVRHQSTHPDEWPTVRT